MSPYKEKWKSFTTRKMLKKAECNMTPATGLPSWEVLAARKHVGPDPNDLP